MTTLTTSLDLRSPFNRRLLAHRARVADDAQRERERIYCDDTPRTARSRWDYAQRRFIFPGSTSRYGLAR